LIQKETTMTLPHQDATARIIIDGLAICCFNSRANAWEIGFLRDPQPPLHRLSLIIDGDGIDIPNTVTRMSFLATNPQTPQYPGTPNGFFDPNGSHQSRKRFPTSADDLEDFRWIVNVQDPQDAGHGRATPKPCDFPVTRAFLHDAVLYTSKLMANSVFRLPFTNRPADNPNNIPDPQLKQHEFGRTNDEVGADIFCNPANGNVTIEIPDVLRQPRVLPHRPGNPWKIRLTNLCRPVGTGKKYEIGDFQLFYSALDVSGQKQAIWGEPTTDRLASGRVDCDITWLGGEASLDGMMP
jgi:hypothetical protein